MNANINLIKENVTQIKSRISINVGASAKIWRNIVCEKYYMWNPVTCSCENGKCIGSVIDDSVIMCDEIIEETKNILTKTVLTKTVPRNFNEKQVIF